jgi:hypothetical protein
MNFENKKRKYSEAFYIPIDNDRTDIKKRKLNEEPSIEEMIQYLINIR